MSAYVRCPHCGFDSVYKESLGWWRCYACGRKFEHWDRDDQMKRDLDFEDDLEKTP